MSALGAFTFVLHSHIPYARLAGRWPHGEEWIHQAACETYIPLLRTLYDLQAEGIPFHLNFDMTPVLAEQLTAPDILDHLDTYLDERIEAARKDIAFFEVHNDPHLRYLAEWYYNWLTGIKQDFHERFNRDLIGAFRQLQDDGYIEIMTSAATHGYLPLLGHDSSLRGQIKTAIKAHERHFGRRPTSFWLPECAYRPAYITDDSQTRPGLEQFLVEEGFRIFFCETHAITGGQPVGVSAGNVIGPYGQISRQYVIPPNRSMPERPASTFAPYYVADTSAGSGAGHHTGIAVIGRNNRTGMQVWSAEWGYPGDVDYREFHKRAGTSGFKYWRVTSDEIDLDEKDYYHPDWAAYKVDQHAEHFAHLVGDILREHHRDTGQYGVILAAYDAELFGHWWFEGVDWLGKVLRHLSDDPAVDMMTANAFIDQHPPTERLSLPEGSWGVGGTHFNWENAENNWMWPAIHEAEARMTALADRFTTPSETERALLNQAARELLLLQSSDWPFLITTGQAREYAIQRFTQHVHRFEKLAASLESGSPNAELAAQYWEIDKIFADIDYRWFASQTT